MSNIQAGGNIIGCPSFVSPASGLISFGFTIDFDFANGVYFGGDLTSLTFTRATVATDLFPSSASGASFNTYSSGQMRIIPGVGLIIERQTTNLLLNSGTPATQTTASLATGTYTLWVNGSGNATVSAGTATINAGGTASQGSEYTFSVTVAGTVVVTVAGSLNQFQLELNQHGTSYVPTTGVTVTRNNETAVFNSLPAINSAIGFTIFGSATPYWANNANNSCVIFGLDDGTGTNTNRLQIFRRLGNNQARAVNSSGGSASSPDMGNVVWNQFTLGKLAATTVQGAQTFVYAGVNTFSGTDNFPASLTTMRIGNNPQPGVDDWEGPIAHIAFAPIVVPLSVLQLITT